MHDFSCILPTLYIPMPTGQKRVSAIVCDIELNTSFDGQKIADSEYVYNSILQKNVAYPLLVRTSEGKVIQIVVYIFFIYLLTH